MLCSVLIQQGLILANYYDMSHWSKLLNLLFFYFMILTYQTSKATGNIYGYVNLQFRQVKR